MGKIKYKHLLFWAFIIVFLFSSNDFALALEVKYPVLTILLLPDINLPTTTLTDYVSYFFGLLIRIAGVLAVISFAIGAVGLINPNIEAHNEAKARMRSAVLGLVLTLVSWVILLTINPQFVNINPDAAQTTSGVFLTDGVNNKPCPSTAPNTSNLPSGYDEITYICPPPADPGKGSTAPPALLVWLFPNAGLEGGNSDLSSVNVQRVECGSGGGGVNISDIGSFIIAFETPGVYFYLDSGCSKYASTAITGSLNQISAPFKGAIKGVKIVNDPDNTNVVYGVIFHGVVGLENGGPCQEPIGNDAECKPVNITPFAADIFNINQESSPVSSGDGVVFYSAPFEDAIGARAGYNWVKNDSIKSDLQPNGSALGTFKWDGVDRTKAYQDYCTSLSKCPGSIDIKGNYTVGLYSENPSDGGGLYCQTFTVSVPNLTTQAIMASEAGAELKNIYIIPTGVGSYEGGAGEAEGES